MTSLRDAYPASMPTGGQQEGYAPPMQPTPQQPMPIPHGAPQGSSAGSMDMKTPIRQMTAEESRLPMDQYLHQLQQQPQAQAQAQPGRQQQDPYAAQMAQLQRQQLQQAQVAAAESRIRGIARQESRFQSIGFVAIGMCIVFVAIFLMQMRGHMNFSSQ